MTDHELLELTAKAAGMKKNRRTKMTDIKLPPPELMMPSIAPDGEGGKNFYSESTVLALVEADRAERGKPVAWRYRYKFRDIGETGAYEYHSNEFACIARLPEGEPLYTSPSPPAPDVARDLVDALEELLYAHTDKAESMAHAALAKAGSAK